MIWQVLLALGIALVADWKGLLTRSIGDRIAMLLVAFVYSSVMLLTTLDGKLLAVGGWLQTQAGSLAGRLDPTLGAAVGKYLLAILGVVAGVLWLAALLPTSASRYVGGIANHQIDSRMIWVGTGVFVLCANLVPGQIGDFLRGAAQIAGTTGHALVSWVA
jgi:hypothetical protein